MNISLSICGLIVAVFTAFFFFKEKRIPTISNKIFEKMILFILLASVLDIGSVFFASGIFGAFLSDTVQKYGALLLVKTYYLVLLHVVFLLLNYVLSKFNIKENALITNIQYLVLLFELLLPVSFDPGKYGYFRGIGKIYCFAACAIVLIVAAAAIFVNKKNLTTKEKEASLLWSIVWIIAAILQIVYPEIYYATFACSLGLLSTFVELENPEGKRDASSDAFHAYYLNEYARLCTQDQTDFSLGAVKTNNEKDVVLIHNLICDKNTYLFKDTDTHFYIVSTKYSNLKDLLKQYSKATGTASALFERANHEDYEKLLPFLKKMISKERNNYLHVYTNSDLLREEEEEKIKQEIVEALKEDRVVAFVQPIYDVKKEIFTSGECLCRLKRRGGEILPPYKFIAVAEKCGLIEEIETVMFENMCNIYKKVRHLNVDTLEANLSVRKGEAFNLLQEYSDILYKHNLTPDCINLEITETDVVEKKEAILRNIKEMTKAGFTFSLDDFGTGESNLGYVIDMPVSFIKFDRDITKKAILESRANIVVQNAVRMAHDLGIKVVAEGVETERDFLICKNMGIDYIQGYYFSKPIPEDELIDFLIKNNAYKRSSL